MWALKCCRISILEGLQNPTGKALSNVALLVLLGKEEQAGDLQRSLPARIIL